MKHQLPGWLAFISVLLVIGCKSSKKDEESKEKFFPVVSFLKSQVAHVDTSMYSIRKIVFIDSTRMDTVYFPREQFRDLAVDFLSIPDLSDPKFCKRFKEERQFDESLNKVILTYIPVDAEKEEIQKQEVLITPSPAGDKITTIIIDHYLNTRDSTVQKRLLWQVDKRFQVVKSSQLPGQPEINTTFQVVWNDDEEY